MEGLRSIFDEANKLCRENGEMDKYLMTFQNFITRIPKWNASIIENERIRIVEKSGCGYLEDLVTCVHIIQLKILAQMNP
jgi:GTP:adenosylcobinamide-phosphate guanylyltransferase